jgi:hypothetical protein
VFARNAPVDAGALSSAVLDKAAQRIRWRRLVPFHPDRLADPRSDLGIRDGAPANGAFIPLHRLKGRWTRGRVDTRSIPGVKLAPRVSWGQPINLPRPQHFST